MVDLKNLLQNADLATLRQEIERLFSEAGFHLSQVAEEQVEGEIIAMLERCSNLSPEERAAVFAEGQKRIGSVLHNSGIRA